MPCFHSDYPPVTFKFSPFKNMFLLGMNCRVMREYAFGDANNQPHTGRDRPAEVPAEAHRNELNDAARCDPADTVKKTDETYNENAGDKSCANQLRCEFLHINILLILLS